MNHPLNFKNSNLESTEPKNPGFSLLSLAATCILGCGITAVLYLNSISADEKLVRIRLERGVEALAIFSTIPNVNTTISDIFDRLTEIQLDLNSGLALDKEIFDRYLWNPTPVGLETTTLEYITRLKSKGEDTYPVYLEATYDDRSQTIGLDRTSNTVYEIAMSQARDTGILTSFTAFPLAGLDNEKMISHYYLPIYKANSNPVSITERRENHIGYISAVSYLPAETMLPFLPDNMQGIEAAFISQDQLSPINEYSQSIENDFINGKLHQASFQALGNDMNIVGQASQRLTNSMQSNNRWWVLSCGLFLTIWLSGMLLWSRLQSTKIIDLVEERTLALAKSESRYRMLAKNSTDVITTYDLDYNYTYISPSFESQTDLSIKKLLGKSITTYLTDQSSKVVLEKMAAAKSLYEKDPTSIPPSETIEIETLSNTGITKPVEITLSLLFDNSDLLIGFIAASRDITRRKNTEEEKQKLEEAYRQSQKMEAIGTLAGGIAHDFNNLLAGILGHTDLLQLKNNDDPEIQSSLNTIEATVIRGKELTGQLLGFARQGQYKLEPVAVNEILAEIISLISRTIDRNIEIEITPSEENPVIQGDPTQLSQIFLNLAVNARDAMPNGGKLIFETDIQDLDQGFCNNLSNIKPGRYCIISVSDTGIGISKEKMKRVFEPFFTDKEEGKGTGMGLAMVYGVTQNHGGDITLSSIEGKGTTFKIYLPAEKSSASSKTQSPKDENLTRVNGEGQTILVVDDEVVVREITKAILSTFGYTVILAENGKEALRMYKNNWSNIDLVAIDMIMPIMGGLECLKEMKKINPDLRAILATGYSQQNISDEVNEDYILGLIQKPFRLKEFSDLLISIQ